MCIAFDDIRINGAYMDLQGDMCIITDKESTLEGHIITLFYEDGQYVEMEYDPMWLSPCQ